MLSKKQQTIKRIFDILISIIGILIVFIPLLLMLIIASISTRKNGLFLQKRVGKNAKLFTIYKIRTMHDDENQYPISIKNDKRLTLFGKFLRNYKLDEIPQLFNVLFGDMSIVGPRPDVEGYADQLTGNDRIVLNVKPGITSPATLYFYNEEDLLAEATNPKEYNDTVIWPKKVILNKEYVQNWSFKSDCKIILKTLFKYFT